ncbi:hypothetical protein B9Z55_021195 [Caenorhabditis nigoni]|nr:hypothetical protein B9Z55_021195 [Caenorhabditis nigoni]
MMLSSENVRRLVERCIPKELIPIDWKCDQSDILSNLESLLKCSRGQLGMCESATALFQSLTNFLSAPGCANLLQFDGVYTISPSSYMSIKGEHYMYKMDVVELFSLAIPCPFKDWQAELVRLAMKRHLKCFEADWISRFNSHCEMIKMDIGILNDFNKKLYMCSKSFSKKTDFIDVETPDGSYEILKSFEEKYPMAENWHFYNRMFSWIATVGKQFKSLVEESFMTADLKATVRLFKIGKDSYVMAHELLQSMKNKKMDVSEFEEEVLKMSNLAAFEFRDVARKVKVGDMKNIEFIQNTFNVSTISIPIPAPDGTYCVPASEALYDVISDMIVAKKVLQRIDRDQFEHIIQFFKSMEHIFRIEGGDFFISMEDVEWIKANWEKTYEEKLKSSRTVKTIRKVRKGGFTEEDLDKELEYLSLYKSFPEMKQEVEWVYNSDCQGCAFKLRDMHAAVFQCQMAFLLSTIQNVHTFLHNQKMCMEWVPYLECLECVPEGELEEMMTTVETPPQEAKVDVDQEVDIPKKKRSSRKAKKSEESNQSSIPSTSEPELPEMSKESQSCPKCSRASHFADVATEKLKISKVECKHLKKDLANAELEVEIQKEKIRRLEDLLKSKDDIIERQNMDLLEKQNMIMNLEMEVDSKENIIKNLENSGLKKEDQADRDVLFKLLEIQGTLRSENPIGKCRELGHRLSMNAKNKYIEDATRAEVYRFCEQAKTYIRAVDSQLKMIRGSHRTKPEKIPELPEFPALSQEFRKAYKNVVKLEAPKICESLLKAPEILEIADTDCLICIAEMESKEGTIKCECCNRRYHSHCAREWFKTKRTCPACSSALLDDSEFPPLGRG